MESRPTSKRKGSVNYNEDDYINGELTLQDADNLATKSLLDAEKQRDNERALLADLDEEDTVETLAPTPYNSNKVKLQLRITAKVILSGSVSGKEYVWQTSGAVVEVDAEDAPGLLDKKLGDKACCGGNPENLKLFVLIGD